ETWDACGGPDGLGGGGCGAVGAQCGVSAACGASRCDDPGVPRPGTRRRELSRLRAADPAGLPLHGVAGGHDVGLRHVRRAVGPALERGAGALLGGDAGRAGAWGAGGVAGGAGGLGSLSRRGLRFRGGRRGGGDHGGPCGRGLPGADDLRTGGRVQGDSPLPL
ncbi:MAG: hypothetical protein AVDCRST_MAG15-543, partial [uncultured Rubellimicrobium sp.]